VGYIPEDPVLFVLAEHLDSVGPWSSIDDMQFLD
jgi:hypothetical protein